MTAAHLHPRLPVPLLRFGLLAVGIYAVEVLLVRSGAFARDPELAAGAVVFDLTVLVPALFYLLVVRPKRLPAVSVVVVFLASLLGASLVLPAEHESLLDLMLYLVVPAELLLAGYVGVRAYRGIRRVALARTDERVDLVERIRSLLRDVLPVPAVAGVIAYEFAVLYYAIFSWRSTPDVGEGEIAFSYHRKNGYTGLIVALTLVTLVETAAVHLLVQQWSTTAAWVLTAVSLYAVVWLLGQLQAVRLLPILLTPDSLRVRVGLLWSVRVPYDRIATVVRPAPRDLRGPRAKDYLHAVTLGDARLLLELCDPLDVQGPYGYTKRGVRRIGVAVDERDSFAAELQARVGAPPGG